MTSEEKQDRYYKSLNQLRHAIADWADENPAIVRYPEPFADYMVAYADNLLGDRDVEV